MTTTFAKRSKEKTRQEKQNAKALARKERAQARKDAPPRIPGEDPDLAGIIPGPQPLAYE